LGKGDALAAMPPEKATKTVAELAVRSAVQVLGAAETELVKIKEEVMFEIEDKEDENTDSS
jgi:hypothetical protein